VIFAEHFGKTAWVYCKRLQNYGALNFVQFFLDHSVFRDMETEKVILNT